MDLNYEEDLIIDHNALDIEWLRQPELAHKYARHLVGLQNKLRRFEERKKILRSELILEVNLNPEGCCNKPKPNASDIEAYYRSHKDYKELIEELNDAITEVAYAEIAKNEIIFTRKESLANLVQLHGQQYFAGPRMPRNLDEKVKASKKTNAQVARSLNRKRII